MATRIIGQTVMRDEGKRNTRADLPRAGGLGGNASCERPRPRLFLKGDP
jgi:hypothetical protein